MNIYFDLNSEDYQLLITAIDSAIGMLANGKNEVCGHYNEKIKKDIRKYERIKTSLKSFYIGLIKEPDLRGCPVDLDVDSKEDFILLETAVDSAKIMINKAKEVLAGHYIGEYEAELREYERLSKHLSNRRDSYLG